MLRKAVLIFVGGLFAIFLIGSLSFWFFLSWWVPSAGKTRLIEELEKRAPISVHIESIRYEWPQDIVLSEVAVNSRQSGETFFASPVLRLRLGWLSLLLRKQCVFRATSPMTLPCQTTAEVDGWFDLRSTALNATLSLQKFKRENLASFIQKRIPQALQGGDLRLQLTAQQSAKHPLSLDGKLTGEAIVWALPSGQLIADGTVQAQARSPENQKGPWIVEVDAALSRGKIDALPSIGPVSDIEASLHYSNQTVILKQLKASLLGSTWQAEGSTTEKAFEFFVTTEANTGSLIQTFPEMDKDWDTEGTADIRAVCRGNPRQNQLLDCLIAASSKKLSVGFSRFNQPFNDVTGNLDYDLLTRRLTLNPLKAVYANQPVTASGTIDLFSKPGISLRLEGSFPLADITPWLGQKNPVKTLDGLARFAVTANGWLTHPALSGEITLEETQAETDWGQFNNLNTSLRIDDEVFALDELTADLNGQPLSLKAQISPSPFSPAISPKTLFIINGQGRLSLLSAQWRGRMDPYLIWIDEADLAMEESRLRLAGAIARKAQARSRLTANGIIALHELGRLPWKLFGIFQKWQLEGLADAELTFDGLMADPKAADVSARLRAQSLRVRQIPLDDVRCAIDQEKGVLRLNIPSTLVAGGTLIANFALQQNESDHPYQLQADLSGLQLEQLKNTVPAWKDRAVSGNASAHAKLSGLSEKRATWVGEGWINMAGSQLGDVPLLDQLFRGLFGVLADRLGLEMLRRAEITQASTSWMLKQERLLTEDLRLGGVAAHEPVAVYARGSLGLDGSLDFIIEPEFSEAILLQAPSTSTLASTILKAAGQLDRARRLVGRHRLTGSLKKPTYRFELSLQETLKQLAPRPADLIQGLQGILDAVRQQQ